MDLDQLNPQQKEALETYLSIMETDDVEAAFIKLTTHDFNVEAAIQASFDEPREEQNESDRTPLTGNTRNSSNTNSNTNTNTNRDPKRSFWSYLSIPVLLISRVLLSVLYIPLFLFRSFKTIGYNRVNTNQPIMHYQDQFEEEYGDVHPEFLGSGYAQALELAKRDLKILAVVLHSDQHDDMPRFCTEVLASPQFVEFFRENQILCWAGNVKYAEGYQVSNILQAGTFPFVALVCLQRRPNQSDSGKMLVVDRIEGFHTAENMIQRIGRQIERCSGYLEQIRSDRLERETSRSIREEQDRAYLESLRQDQEKERKAREERERIERENHEKELAALEALELAKRRAIYRRQLKATLPPEPSSNDKNVAKIQFRLPNNDRVVRRFHAHDTLQTLYDYVESLQVEPEEDQLDLNGGLPDDYVHEPKFIIVSPYPRIDYQPNQNPLESCKGLWPSASLVVEPLDLSIVN